MKREFRIVIESPYGKQPVEQFKHFIHKVSDESLERWGIEISISEIDESDEEATKDDFQ